jgi:hypothetical protein
MSRNLPDRPNLEFLKKEAKALLDGLQQRDASAQLTDAQHALARDYGFASWPKLKAHVEAMSPGPGPRSAEREGGHPFAGRWIADVARSTRHPANLFQRATIEVAVDGNTVAFDDEFVDGAGQVVRGHNTIVADGVSHTTLNGYTLTATWRSPRALETVATKNGEVVGRGTYAVSADGTQLTITASDQTIVLHRAAAATL